MFLEEYLLLCLEMIDFLFAWFDFVSDQGQTVEIIVCHELHELGSNCFELVGEVFDFKFRSDQVQTG